ncbi:hypothetical protein N0V85_009945, partial [Neurospora sp. IMI 360204]
MTKGKKRLDFEDRFTTLIDRCDLDDSMKTHYLKMKFTDEVRNIIAYQQELPAPNDYDKWLALHRKLATNLEERDCATRPPSGGGSASTERTVSQGGNAMDLDAMSALDVSLARMIDKAVIDYRVQNN